MTSVAVCPICDIAGCYHIREASEARASASHALGAAWMREQAAVTADATDAKAFRSRYTTEYGRKMYQPFRVESTVNNALNIQSEDAANAIRALPMPTDADLLAEAMKLPETRALVGVFCELLDAFGPIAKNCADTYLKGFMANLVARSTEALAPFTASEGQQ